MAASILHFGDEVADRFPQLRYAGYAITRYVTLHEFQDALRCGVEHDAVSLSDLEEHVSPLVARAARSYSSAPLILFRTRDVHPAPATVPENPDAHAVPEVRYDLVVSPGARAQAWLDDIAALIRKGRALMLESELTQQASAQLRREVRALREEFQGERERAQEERARRAEADSAKSPAMLVDRVLTCSNCRQEFVFSAAEQFLFQQRNFFNDPRSCRKCRTEYRKRPHLSGPESVVKCAACGAVTRVPFKPRQGRPVLCRPCFDKLGTAPEPAPDRPDGQ
jgi:CxxC-x17-CxxC domain-containing protein